MIIFIMLFYCLSALKRKKYNHKKTDGRTSTSSEDSRGLSLRPPQHRSSQATILPYPHIQRTNKDFIAAQPMDYQIVTYQKIGVLNLAQNSSKKQDPLELLLKIFPHKKRNVLELVLQGCGGDTVQAIEQVLNTQREEEKATNRLTHPGLPLPPFNPHLHNSVFKSAFSPTSSLSAASHLHALRYGMGGGYVSRNLALTLPYPHFLPGISVGSTIGLNGAPGTTDDKMAPYSMYPLWHGKTYPTKEVGKTPGCLGD